MTHPRRPASGSPIRREAERLRPWTVTPAGAPPRALPPTRRYEILWSSSNGEILEATRIAPAIPAFEAAFAAFARGALITTPLGEVAIEDMLPGTQVMTRQGPRQVRWVGRIMLPPANLRQDGGPEVYRISADTFGPMLPAPDLVLCSGARRVHRAPRLGRLGGASEVLVPVGDFADGISVTQLSPISAVPAYHLMLDSHALIEANGMEVETYHPGRDVNAEIAPEMMRLFLSLFPQLDGDVGFGPLALQRMDLETLDLEARSA